eukprot:6817765-Pyramimonas_sp.AAC.1
MPSGIAEVADKTEGALPGRLPKRARASALRMERLVCARVGPAWYPVPREHQRAEEEKYLAEQPYH